MTAKKADKTPDIDVSPDDAPANDRSILVSDWAGYPHYQCPFCAFDSLDEQRVIDHLAERHPLPPPPKPADDEGDQVDAPQTTPPENADGGTTPPTED